MRFVLSLAPQEEYRNNLPQPQLQQQKLRVCEVCAAYLCLYDNDRRYVWYDMYDEMTMLQCGT